MREKVCFKCELSLPVYDFHLHPQMKDGRLNKCRFCVVKDVAAWRAKKGPEARKKEFEAARARVDARGRKRNYTPHGAGRGTNVDPAKKSAAGLQYINRKRSASKVEPSELDRFVFGEAVALREMRAAVTGVRWHVDHVVPIGHKDACGLHNAFNLQVIPASINQSKSNRSMAHWMGL